MTALLVVGIAVSLRRDECRSIAALNTEASRIGETIAPELPWSTDEEIDLTYLWETSQHLNQHVGGRWFWLNARARRYARQGQSLPDWLVAELKRSPARRMQAAPGS